MQPLPLVSICIPVFNGELHLAEALDSALAQSYPNVEVIVVDNASTDGTASILETYQQTENLKTGSSQRLRCYRNDSTVSMVENFNRATAEARGDYLKILPHDDVLVEDGVEILMSATRPGDALVFGLRDFIFEDTEILQRLFYANQNVAYRADRRIGAGNISAEQYLGVVAENCTHNTLGEPGSALISTKALRESEGFHPAYHQLCDLRLWHVLASRHGLRIIPKKVARFRVHARSESSKRGAATNEALLKEHLGLSELIYDRLSARVESQSLDKTLQAKLERAREKALLNRLLDDSRLQLARGKQSPAGPLPKPVREARLARVAQRMAALPVKRVYQLIVLRLVWAALRRV